MDLECVICCGSLTEGLDVQRTGGPPNYHRHEASFSGPSSSSVAVAPRSPELCVPPCGHMFHKKCIMNWLWIGNSESCPACRKEFTERQLVTVFLPVVNSVEKRCDECQKTKNTCVCELIAEKEELKKLYDGKVERVRDLEEKNERLYMLYEENKGLPWRLAGKEQEVHKLTVEKKHFKSLYEKEKEQREGGEKGEKNGGKSSAEGNDSRGKDLLLMEKRRRRIIAYKLLEEERKVEQLTTEKEKFKMWYQDEKERRKGVEIKSKNTETLSEGYVNRIHHLINENTELVTRVSKERKNVEILVNQAVCNRRERALNSSRDDLMVNALREKVEEVQETLNELQERHSLLIGDIEEMTTKYEAEREKANILEERVASLEAEARQP